MTLVEFLLARIGEDEAAARAATAGPWTVDAAPFVPEVIYDATGRSIVGARSDEEPSAFGAPEDAVHIARHDPARVLAECEAKRRIVEMYRASECPDPCHDETVFTVLRALAQPYADHPDYQEAAYMTLRAPLRALRRPQEECADLPALRARLEALASKWESVDYRGPRPPEYRCAAQLRAILETTSWLQGLGASER